MKTIIPVLGIITLFLTGCSSTKDAPKILTNNFVSVSLKERYEGKGHFAEIKLVLNNPTSDPIWVLIASFSNKPLRIKKQYIVDKPKADAFEAAQYDEGSGVVVRLAHYGKDDFKAIYLPSNAHIEFHSYELSANKPVATHDFIVTKKLLVNGTTPIEEWIPYDIKSSSSAVIQKGIYSGSQRYLNWFHNNSRASNPYPDEHVEFISMTGFLEKITINLHNQHIDFTVKTPDE